MDAAADWFGGYVVGGAERRLYLVLKISKYPIYAQNLMFFVPAAIVMYRFSNFLGIE